MGCLVLTEAEVQRIRRQLEEFPWYRRVFAGFRERVDEWIERKPEIPVEKGRAFWESCPNDGTLLVFDPYDRYTHRCPKCGTNWSDEKYNGAWVRIFQDWLQRRAIEAGILYRVLGGEKYAEVVRDALVHYADHYEEYPLANNLLGPTRLFQSTYLEAFWLNDMVVAYDLVSESPCFAPEDHAKIRQLFYASTAIIRSFDERISNRQAFNNVGMGAVALLYDDAELLEHVLRGPSGFEFQLQASLLEDGLWYEGENYHFATLDHLLNLAELARHRDIDLYTPLRPMFEGPLKLMYPDFTFPSRKDGWFGRGILYHKDIYELGYARYRDERMGGLLSQAYEEAGGREELGWRAFLYCEPVLPKLALAQLRTQTCENMPGTGAAVIRRDEGGTYASVEYGHYGGGHGHPDRLHLSFFDQGKLWLLDPGTGWYHVPELSWYRSTLAHNTVVVDGVSQAPREGVLTAFGDAGHFQVSQAQVDDVYPGVDMRRTLCLGQDFLLDVVDIWSEQEHVYDWVIHTRAAVEMQAGCTAQPCPEGLGQRDGYEYLRNVQRWDGDRLDAVLSWDDARLRVVQLPSSSIYTARTLGIPLQEEIPNHTIVARRRGATTRFATCIFRNQENMDRAELREVRPGCYEIALGDRVAAVYVGDDKGVVIQASSGGEPQGLYWFGRQNFATEFLEVAGDRVLPCASLVSLGDGTWKLNVPAEFGRVTFRGWQVEWHLQVQDAAVEIQQAPGSLTAVQRQAVSIWLDEKLQGGPVRFYRGCVNTLVYYVGYYGAPDEVESQIVLPEGWQLVDSRCTTMQAVGRYEVTVRVPSTGASGDRAAVVIAAGERRKVVPVQLEAPVRAAWAVDSSADGPRVNVTVTSLLDRDCTVNVQLHAPWLSDQPTATALRMVPGSVGVVGLELPLKPTPAPDWERIAAAFHKLDSHFELPGLSASGEYPVYALIEVDGFQGKSLARLPLYWAVPAGADAAPWVSLNRGEQAYWTEVPYQGEEDCSAQAAVTWDDRGMHLWCRVLDDVHVTDANEDDLYENDSVQVYFDFRDHNRGDHNFGPGVAAYILAPDDSKSRLRIQVIAGNREISNRDAKAPWVTVDNVVGHVKKAQSGYEIRCFFPYSSLGVPPIQPGDVVGFDFAVSDNDGTWYRKYQLVWSGSRGRRCYIRGSYHNPAEFGWLIAVGEDGDGLCASQ
ncbi:MAG: sugar-binding protein [Limnochordia bacterium]|jgi:hypothetical protein